MQIKSKQRVRDYAEVFTNQREVTAMCDMLPPEMFMPEPTFLEPCCGEGIFVLEILRRKFKNCKKRSEFKTALKSVWAMEIQKDNVDISIENVKKLCETEFNLKLTKDEKEIIENHIIQADSLKVMNMLSVGGGMN